MNSTAPKGNGAKVIEPKSTWIADEDAFGHEDYATAAARFLEAEAPPFTLGLFGPWGVGKTWILERIQEKFTSSGGDEKLTASFVMFDAWKYEDDALRRQFLREVASQLFERGESDFDPEKELSDLDESQSRDVERIERGKGVWLDALVRASIAAIALFVVLHLRHAAASRLIVARLDPLTVAAVLGHEDPTVTLRVYAHLWDRERTDDAVRAALAQ